MRVFIETAGLLLVSLFVGYGLYWFATFNLPTGKQMDPFLVLPEPVSADYYVVNGKLKRVEERR